MCQDLRQKLQRDLGFLSELITGDETPWKGRRSWPKYEECHIYSNVRRGFSINLVLKFAYEVPNWTVPSEIALNWTMRGQTKACLARFSLVDKRENRVWLKLPDTIFFLACPLSNFLKNLAPFLSSGKETPNLVVPLDWAIHIHWGLHKQNLVQICTWEQLVQG
jgi:hypothetical protein